MAGPTDKKVLTEYESPTTEGEAQANAAIAAVQEKAEQIATRNSERADERHDGLMKAIGDLREDLARQNKELAALHAVDEDAAHERAAREQEAYDAKVEEMQALTKQLAEREVGSSLEPLMSEYQRRCHAEAVERRRTLAVREVKDAQESYMHDFLALFSKSKGALAREKLGTLGEKGKEAEAVYQRNLGSGDRYVYGATETSSDDYQGGLYIPREMEERILPRSMQRGAMREVADVVMVPQGGGNSRGFPIQNSRAEAKWVGTGEENIDEMELGEDAVIDISLRQVFYKHKFLRTWWSDTPSFSVEHALSKMRIAIMDAENKAFIQADRAVTRPVGVLSLPVADVSDSHDWQNIQRVKSGHATKITSGVGADRGASKSSADALIEMSSAVWDDKLNERASYIMRRKTRTTARLLVDGDGNLVWRDSVMAGHPSMLLGYRVLLDDFMPEEGAGNKAVLFICGGAYTILEKAGEPLTLKMDDITQDTHDILRMYKRCGGDLTDRWSAVVLTCETR